MLFGWLVSGRLRRTPAQPEPQEEPSQQRRRSSPDCEDRSQNHGRKEPSPTRTGTSVGFVPRAFHLAATHWPVVFVVVWLHVVHLPLCLVRSAYWSEGRNSDQ